MADLAEENARLMRQAAYFASDDHIKERAAIWRGRTPEECLAATLGLCADGAFFWAQLDPAARERVRAVDRLPEDALGIFSRLRRQR